ncbi:MAG: hypothetical protein RIC55_34755 [Pirellulaceae bacterium]
MGRSELDRRTFNKLTAAALGGMMTGAAIGCGGGGDLDQPSAGVSEKHLCRGLNDCKGLGGDGKNDCRGMGTCATHAHHECGAKNACKGQGGCGEEVGTNECAGHGGCAVPLMDHAWDEVRERLVEKWEKDGVKFHDAPAKAPVAPAPSASPEA